VVLACDVAGLAIELDDAAGEGIRRLDEGEDEARDRRAGDLLDAARVPVGLMVVAVARDRVLHDRETARVLRRLHVEHHRGRRGRGTEEPVQAVRTAPAENPGYGVAPVPRDLELPPVEDLSDVRQVTQRGGLRVRDFALLARDRLPGLGLLDEGLPRGGVL